MTQVIIIAISCIASAFGFLIYILINAIKSKVVAEEESKDDEAALAIQDKYTEISSRPDYDVNTLKQRMREDARGDSGS